MLVSSLKIQRQGKIPSKTVLFTILSQGRKKKKKYFTKKQSRKTVSYSQEVIAFTKKKKKEKNQKWLSVKCK